MSRWEETESENAAPAPLSALLRRRWRWAAAVMTGVWMLTWSLAWLLPARYDARSVIQIAPPPVPRDYVMPNGSTQPLAQLPALMERLLSPAPLRREAEHLHLYPHMKAARGAAAVAARLRRGLTLTPLEANLNPRIAPTMALLEVRYRASSPKRAQQVAQALATDWVQELRREGEQHSAQTTAFLQQQARQAAARLARRAQAVEEFQRRYSGELPAQAGGLQQEISNDLNQLAAARQQARQAHQQARYLDALLHRYQRLQNQIAAGPFNPSPERQSLAAQRTSIAAQLAQLETEDTAANPDIQALRQKLAALQRLERAQPPAPVAQLPLTAEMMQLASRRQSNQLALGSALADERRLQARLARRQQQLALAPLRGQQLDALTTRLNAAQAAYNSLASRAQQSALATALERREQGRQTRVLVPATRPERPNWPNRAQWNWMGLLLGLALGAGTAAALESHDDRLWTQEALPGGTLLAAIPRLATEAELRRADRQRRWTWAVSLLLVLLIAAGSWWSLR